MSEKSGKLKFASACNYIRVEVAAFGSLWAWTLDMFIIDTLVAFNKLVTMLVTGIINVKQRLFKRYAVYRYSLPVQATGKVREFHVVRKVATLILGKPVTQAQH